MMVGTIGRYVATGVLCIATGVGGYLVKDRQVQSMPYRVEKNGDGYEFVDSEADMRYDATMITPLYDKASEMKQILESVHATKGIAKKEKKADLDSLVK